MDIPSRIILRYLLVLLPCLLAAVVILSHFLTWSQTYLVLLVPAGLSYLGLCIWWMRRDGNRATESSDDKEISSTR